MSRPPSRGAGEDRTWRASDSRDQASTSRLLSGRDGVSRTSAETTSSSSGSGTTSSGETGLSEVRQERDKSVFEAVIGLNHFLKKAPKAELHSHLAGSIRDSTLRDLLPSDSPLHDVLDGAQKRSLLQTFEIFGVIHRTVTTSELLNRIVLEMIEDNADDNVIYLEMRTTPRRLQDYQFAEGEAFTRTICPSPGQVKDLDEDGDGLDCALNNYVETVAHAVQAAAAVIEKKIHVRLIISVNRTSPIESVERIIRLALAWRRASSLVVGLDVSGDPTKGDLFPILALLNKYIKGGFEQSAEMLKVCIHAGETMNVAETEAVLDYRPERLGHLCVISEATRQRMLALKIPLELCPTSNALTLHLPDLSYHPQIKFWLDNDYPLAISTDDSGVFGVTLSDEFLLVAQTGNLTLHQSGKLVLQTFEFLFCDDSLKNQLREFASKSIDTLLNLSHSR